MNRVCAWCRASMGESPSDGWSPSVTHGICPACASRVRAVSGVSLRRFLDELNAPVLLVDSEGVIVTANAQARDLLHKELYGIEGFRGGTVFECRSSYLPGGCGQTEHCDGCAIRKSVMATYETGEPLACRPVSLDHREAGPLDVVISTEKVGDVVFLRIDDMRPAGQNLLGNHSEGVSSR